MQRSSWIYQGNVDLFGIPKRERDSILQNAINEISQCGGSLQVRKLPNRYDTDRYRLYCEIGDGDPRPFWMMLRNLSARMPQDHPEQTVEGYDRLGMQREDLLLSGCKVYRQPWEWAQGVQRVMR